ncbi:MAG: hypothetical protein GPJ51_03035 [Candidatus Heimdallarchaeota archaeon]|nr:hypothetical protein [Candidatus Heimdallarchaeota archaeon]
MSKQKTKQKTENENKYLPFSFKESIRANIKLADGNQYKDLNDKEVTIFHGARGLFFYKWDNNSYAVRTYKDGPAYQVEKKYKSKGVWILPVAILLWYAQTIYMFYLQTQQNYFNPVTIVTILLFAGVVFFLAKTLRRQMINVIYLKRNGLEWDNVSFETTPLKEKRTVEVHRGVNHVTLYAGIATALVISFIISSLVFRVGQLPILVEVHELSGWITLDSDTAFEIMTDFEQTLQTINSFINWTVGIGAVLICAVLVAVTVNLRRTKKPDQTAFNIQNEALNYNKETGELYYLDPFINPFENAQLDIDTLNASVFSQQATEKLRVKATGEKLKDSQAHLMDQAVVHKLELVNLRPIVNKIYENLGTKDGKDVDPETLYSEMRVKDIILQRHEQQKTLTEVISLALDRADLLEADRNAKDKAFIEAVQRLEDHELESEGLSIPDKKKKITPLSIVLICFCAILFITLIVLIFLLYNQGAV